MSQATDLFGGAYSERRVLITGNTGFKGCWLSMWLNRLGAQVFGFALPPITEPSLYEVVPDDCFVRQWIRDIRDPIALEEAVREADPHFIFHLAAQPLVRHSYLQPLETVEVNVLGTAHLLEAVRCLGRPLTMVVVTSDKCYENRNETRTLEETDRLGGHDPYSVSKASAELIVGAWRRSFFALSPVPIKTATVRAGNVIGGGDYSADRIVPDAVRALLAGKSIPIRNPHASRSWQHVLDCLSGYLWLGALLQKNDDHHLQDSFNFGPGPAGQRTVGFLVDQILSHWPGQWEDLSDPNAWHEASRLTLSSQKAKRALAWEPVWDFSESVQKTVEWYRACQFQESQMYDFSLRQITDHENAAAGLDRPWGTLKK